MITHVVELQSIVETWIRTLPTLSIRRTVKQLGTDKRNPSSGINKIKEPRQIEHHERREILLSDASAHPWAVMIVPLDAYIAIGAVDGSGRLVEARVVCLLSSHVSMIKSTIIE